MICGVDEAGRGPVLGPMVVAGVTFENDSDLIEMSVKDSKKLSANRRRYLSRKIKELSVDFEIITISASDIDSLRKTMTLNVIEVNAFSKIINRLKPDICYVDSADVNEDRFGKDILSRLNFKPRIISKHKADENYPVVSAASILAKHKRDTEVWSIEKELEKKLKLPLGSGYPADPLTKAFLESWVNKFGELPPYTRHSWKTAENLLKKSKIKRLDDF